MDLPSARCPVSLGPVLHEAYLVPPSVEDLRASWLPPVDGARDELHSMLQRLATGQRLEIGESTEELSQHLDVRPVVPGDDAAELSFVAAVVLRAWGRWLRGVGSSSLPFLLANAVHRRGRLEIREDALVVEMTSAPLDVVVELAGYFDDLEPVSWLGGRRVSYRVRK